MKNHTVIIGAELDKNGIPLPQFLTGDKAEAKLLKRCAVSFGGATLHRSRGSWMNDGKLFLENGFTINIATDSTPAVKGFARWCLTFLNQASAMVIKPDGEIEFVSDKQEQPSTAHAA